MVTERAHRPRLRHRLHEKLRGVERVLDEAHRLCVKTAAARGIGRGAWRRLLLDARTRL